MSKLQLSVPFFASGAAALGLQMVWMKMLAAGLGHEVPSMLAVVSAFFGGMALGGWALDRRIARAANPSRCYAGLQLVAGSWAVLVTLLIPGLNHLARWLMGVTPGGAWQGFISFALPFVALLPATLAMGATLPAMDRWLAALVPDGRCVGRVYAVNTAGAVAGTWLSAFLLMPTLGFRFTAMVFAGMYLVSGLAVLRARPVARDRRPKADQDVASLVLGGRKWVACAFVTGLLGIGFELVGVRVLSQVLENTIYTYAAALAVFLLGTASGAALYQRLGRVAAFEKTLAALLVALATACLVEVWVLSRSLALYDALHARTGDTLTGTMLTASLLAALVFGPSTVLMGATFSHLVQGCRGSGGGVGRASAANTLGGAFAGLLFGVVLLPALGAGWTLVFLAFAYAALALPMLARRGRAAGTSASAWPVKWLFPGTGVLIGFAFLVPKELRIVRLPEGATVREYREGVMASVAVLETPDGHRSLRVNNRFQMGGTAAALAQRRQAHIPLLLHPAPHRALLLGPGTGITLGAVLDHPGVGAEGVELVPEVVALMHHFEPENRGPFRHLPGRAGLEPVDGKAPSLLCADARRFVRASRESYDVVIADLFHPAQDGAGFLYTREHFKAVRDRLAPGGLFCQWLPVHQLDEAMLRTIVATFLEVFPHTQAFLLHFNVDIPVVGLIGSRESWHVSPPALERRLDEPGLRAAMKRSGLDRALNLLGCAVAGPASLRSFAADAPVSTDDYPRVTFGAPRAGARETPVSAALPGLLARWGVDRVALLGAGQGAFVTALTNFIGARDVYLRGLATEGEGKLAGAIEAYLESARRSVNFTPAYARLVNIIQVLAGTDRPAARLLFERLEAAQPAQPLGRQMLGPLLEQP